MRKLLYIAIPIAIIVIIGYSLSGNNVDQSYAYSVADIRAERVRFLKSSSQSPFVVHGLKYRPLDYFKVDPKYKVRANLERIQSSSRVQITNSDGTTNQYKKFAYAKFKLDNQEHQLLILKQAGFGALTNAYFTAFADQTSGESTYGGGRYLDLEIGKSDNITIDFNLAYNPYCAYTPKYTCPLPPRENLLSVAVTAGEKDYKH